MVIPLLQFVLFTAALAAVAPLVGRYLVRVFEGPAPAGRPGAWLERVILKLGGIDGGREHDWREYAGAVLAFSLVGLLGQYAIHRLQAHLPLNPEGLGAVSPDLAFNTAVSFSSNTSWQSYAGETTLSYLSQMCGITWQTLVSMATSMGVAMALVRGLTRVPKSPEDRGLGNFWVDLTRGLLFVVLPLCVVASLAHVATGSIQNLAPYRTVKTLEGDTQRIAMGPAASQVPAKLVAACGGGFFNANSAHPFENPSPLTNALQAFLMLALSAGFLYAFGTMARDTKQGWTLLGVVAGMFLVSTLFTWAAERNAGAALNGLGLDLSAGNLEGKEVRFGVAGSALYSAASTSSSCGAVDAMHSSFTALGGLVLMLNMQVGEVILGGTGTGLYSLVIQAMLAVFLAGLMVGRTPEYLGKSVEMREIKLVVLYILVHPVIVLLLTALALHVPAALSSLGHTGPHGFSEVLYAYTSAAATNGSAFASLNANTPWWNVTLGIAMLAGRFLQLVPMLALAGAMAARSPRPASAGTMPTTGFTFGGLLAAVIVIESGLVFLPSLLIGPAMEHLLSVTGQLF